ncbi:hypothetical protein niasHS_006746 [Heterodera schachtii]|uniref:Mothers against decapentaplegic homolog n=1 Tax=Heterodera schachtii TaxID=97005 RepID=A0ABD2JIF7_HETSC
MSCGASTGQRQHNDAQNAVDPCAHVVHVLMCYQMGGEDEEFVRKAIESLVKKLKDRREQLESLISAVTSGGKQSTSCVTIPRSLDGRLQVAGRKGLPHVVYARIWRWPNVSKTELLKLRSCATPADHVDLICVNPFHYDRVVSSGLSAFDLASFRLNPLSSSSPSAAFRPPPSSDEMPLPIDHSFAHFSGAFDSHPSFSASSSHHLPSVPIEHQSANSNAFDAPFPPIPSFVPHPQQNQQRCPLIVHCLGEGQQPQIGPFQQQMCPQNATDQSQTHRFTHYNFELLQLPSVRKLPDHWCSIAYFELDTQSGELFKVPWQMKEVAIDGGMDPSGALSARFCLGALANVHRSEASERARLHIGKGISLKFADNCEAVFLKCLSQKSVFVRSHFMDFEFGGGSGGGDSIVHKICPGVERKVFDLRWAYAEMCRRRENAQLSAIAHAYAVAGFPSQMPSSSLNSERSAETGVDHLRRMCCTVSLSFVKGWGEGYGRRTIKETPCWIEVQLHRPLQLLNELLQKPE